MITFEDIIKMTIYPIVVGTLTVSFLGLLFNLNALQTGTISFVSVASVILTIRIIRNSKEKRNKVNSDAV